MTDDTHQTYSGDVTLTGAEDPPVELRAPEDAFLRTGSVAGDLEIRNAEYVFTHQPADGDAATAADSGANAVETTIRGDLEDAYADTGGVDGDAVVADADDVFVSAAAVAGSVEAVGAENVYHDDEAPDRDPSAYDVTTTGWKQSGSATDPTVGVYATGIDHDIEVERTRRDIDVYVVGHGHDIEIDGRNAEVSVYFLGYENTVSLGPYLSATVAADTGFDNEIEKDPYPVDDLIETSKDEALGGFVFGRRKLTYQQSATGDDWCPNCGEPADAIVERHHMDALFLFGHPVKVYDRSTDPARECEHCSPNATVTELSAQERKDVLQ